MIVDYYFKTKNVANRIYQNLLKIDIAVLITESKAINSINHQGIKGSIREYGLGRLLIKYLPYGWDVGKGQIHDKYGEQSNETDLIVYNKSVIPPMMFGDNLGLFPIESCKYSIEIKTTSNSKEIKSTIVKFRKLLTLYNSNNNELIHRIYFAYATDLNLKSELERYKNLDSNFHTNPAINVICVIGKGYWYFQKEKKDNRTYSCWKFLKAIEGGYEIACFIGGVINTINTNGPSFGEYLMDKNHSFITVEEKEIS